MLNISKQIHAGWDINLVIPAEQILHEAEIMPDGTSTNELKKLEKFTQKHNKIITVDNVPLPGFTLYSVDKKKWSSTDSTWLVIDPRGFIARITNNNLADILRVTGITEGLIQQKCVWAREDSSTSLTLVPISAEKYNIAVGNTEMLESKVSIKDVSIGDTVLLQNGLQGKYMGVLSLYSDIDRSYHGTLKASVMIRKQVVEILPGKFYFNSDAKILKVLHKTPNLSTKHESAEYINECIKNNTSHYFSQDTKFVTAHQQNYLKIAVVSEHAEPKAKLEFVEISRSEAESIFYKACAARNRGMLMLEDSNNKFVVDFPWWGNTVSSTTDNFKVEKIDSYTEYEINLDKKKPSYYNSIPDRSELKKFDDFKKFYKIVKKVRAITYI